MDYGHHRQRNRRHQTRTHLPPGRASRRELLEACPRSPCSCSRIWGTSARGRFAGPVPAARRVSAGRVGAGGRPPARVAELGTPVLAASDRASGRPWRAALSLRDGLLPEHFVSGLLGRSDAAASCRRSAPAGRSGCGLSPTVLCHRDFHSRNLMVLAGGTWPWSTSRTPAGARHVRLASILRDAYVEIRRGLGGNLIERLSRGAGQPADSREFRRIFALSQPQRMLRPWAALGG